MTTPAVVERLPETAPPAPAQTVEGVLAGLQAQRDQVFADLRTAATTTVQIPVLDRFGDQALGADKQPIFEDTIDTARVNALATTLDALDSEISRLSPAGVSPSVAAQIAATERGQVAAAEQFGAREERLGGEFATREARLTAEAADVAAASERRDRLSSTLSILENEIRIGDTDVREATNRFTAAAEAAQLQRGVLADIGGKVLPAGTEFFPNLGPTGPIAAATAALGQPFQPFRTGGTFGVNPAQLAATIPGALGPSVIPGLDAALAEAAAQLAGLGLPPATGAGRQARAPQTGLNQATAALAGG